jgi:hypothetical protein
MPDLSVKVSIDSRDAVTSANQVADAATKMGAAVEDANTGMVGRA